MKGYKIGADAGSAVVTAMRGLSIEGNVIPLSWFDHIKFADGKPHANAIMILADVVYWYRPVEIRDERTGRVTEYRKKFEGKYLQRSNGDIAAQFGFTTKQVRHALDTLEAFGVLRLHVVKSMKSKDGKPLGNVPYIELDFDKLAEITAPPMPYRAKGYALQGEGYVPTGQSNTETTTENTYTEDNRVAANDTPPAPADTKSSDHPYVMAYREVFQRYPPKAQMARIAKMAVTPPGTEQFKCACESWLMKGFRPTNIDGILEWYRDGVPSYQNGKGRRRTTVPAEPYRPPTQAEIDAARSAPTLEF
jgi:hypothetical protein